MKSLEVEKYLQKLSEHLFEYMNMAYVYTS